MCAGIRIPLTLFFKIDIIRLNPCRKLYICNYAARSSLTNLGEAVSKQWFPPSHFGRLAIFLRRISRIATKTSAVAKGYGETGKDTKKNNLE